MLARRRLLPRLLLPEKSRSIFLHTRDVDPQGLAGSGMFPSAPGVAGKMILKTLESMGTLHGYGIARRIEQTSGDQLIVQYGTLYPALLRLEQEGYIASEWGVSDNHRRARFYKLTRAGRKQVEKESERWEKATAILARFVSPDEEPL